MTDNMVFKNWGDTSPTEEDVFARVIFGSPATLKLIITDVKKIDQNSWKVTFDWNWK